MSLRRSPRGQPIELIGKAVVRSPQRARIPAVTCTKWRKTLRVGAVTERVPGQMSPCSLLCVCGEMLRVFATGAQPSLSLSRGRNEIRLAFFSLGSLASVCLLLCRGLTLLLGIVRIGSAAESD